MASALYTFFYCVKLATLAYVLGEGKPAQPMPSSSLMTAAWRARKKEKSEKRPCVGRAP